MNIGCNRVNPQHTLGGALITNLPLTITRGVQARWTISTALVFKRKCIISLCTQYSVWDFVVLFVLVLLLFASTNVLEVELTQENQQINLVQTDK